MNSTSSTPSPTVQPFLTCNPLISESKIESVAVAYSSGLSSPSKYKKLVDLKHDNAKKAFARSALAMCVKDEAEAVHSSNYIYNHHIENPRPRKYKDQTLIAKEEPLVVNLVTERKKLKEKLTDLTIESLKINIIETIIWYALKGIAFENLPIFVDNKTASIGLKEVYNKLKNSEPYEVPLTLSDLVDFRKMNRVQFFKEVGEFSSIAEKFKIKITSYYTDLTLDKEIGNKRGGKNIDKTKVIKKAPVTKELWDSLNTQFNQILNSLTQSLSDNEDHDEIPALIDTFEKKVTEFNEQFINNDLKEELNNYISKEAIVLKNQIVKCHSKISQPIWNTKDEVLQVIEKYWDSEKLLIKNKLQKNKNPGIENSALTIRDFLAVNYAHGNLSVALLQTTLIDKDFNSLLDQILTVINKKNIALRDNRDKLEILKLEFRQLCDTVDLGFINNTIENINFKKGKGNHFDLLIKEQRQHSLSRFNNLFTYHTAFVNTIAILGEMGQEKYGGKFKEKSAQVVAKLLEYSHIELDKEIKKDDSLALSDEETKRNRLKKEERQRLENLVTINQSHHRIKDIMGHESEKFQDKAKVISTFNLLLGNIEDKGSILSLQRSHTLPFPSCFSWKIDKEIEFINKVMETAFIKKLSDENAKEEIEIEFFDNVENITFIKKINNQTILFSLDLFEKIAKNNLHHTEIEKHFSYEFEILLIKSKTKEEFLFQSLELIRNFYLRLFSETELFPDFINQTVDAASEWSEHGGETYKVAIAASLKALVETGKLCEKSDTVMALKPYLEKSATKLQSLNDTLSSELPNSLFRKILFYQVEETMRMAIKVAMRASMSDDTQVVYNEFVGSVFKKSLYQPIVT